jgi:hypothetical protein
MLNLVRIWQLASCHVVAQETGDRLDILGANPFGRVVFDPNGRMLVLITPSGGSPAQSTSEIAARFKSIVAYTGHWTIERDKFVTNVDGAWDPSWVGTEQVRYYAFDGQTLSLRTAPIDHPSFPGPEGLGYVDWQREA